MKTSTSPGTRKRVSAEDALALWREYKATGSIQVRNRLVMTYAPLVKYIVFKKVRELPARCEVEDFISCGLEALIASIDRYDPAKGATLEQFAWTRIHGAVLDELRRQDWAPRSLRRWERDIAKARDQFTTTQGRRPTREELADALSITVADLRKREVAVLLYVKNLTLREIGEVMGVSESRICQIHSQLKRTLKQQLSDDAVLFSAVG